MRRKAKTGAALSSGVLSAVLLVGGPNAALAAPRGPGATTTTTAAPDPSTTSTSSTVPSTTTTVPSSTTTTVPAKTTVPPRTTTTTQPHGKGLSGVGQRAAPQLGTGKTITETLNPASIVANGVSTSTATATVLGNGTPDPFATVTFTTSDPAEKIGPTTNHADGTYTAVITASTKVETATITATTPNFLLTAQSVVPPQAPPTISASAPLMQTPGPAATIVLGLAPGSIPANGTSTSVATATLRDGFGHVITGDTVRFGSSDPGEKLSAVTNHGNGTYSVVITSSITAGTPLISATDISVSPHLSASAHLVQTPLPATAIRVTAAPASILANGTSTSTATATVTNALGNPVAGQSVVFTSSDPGQRFGAVTDHGDGTYSVTVFSSTTVGTATITAADATVTPHLTATAPLTQTAVPAQPASSGLLPFTGSASFPLTVVGSALVAGGGAVLAVFRRKRPRPAHGRRRR
jgi:hypothetical protein